VGEVDIPIEISYKVQFYTQFSLYSASKSSFQTETLVVLLVNGMEISDVWSTVIIATIVILLFKTFKSADGKLTLSKDINPFCDAKDCIRCNTAIYSDIHQKLRDLSDILSKLAKFS